MKSWITAGLAAAAFASTALAAPDFEVTFTNGAVRTLPAFRVEGGYLHLAEGRIDLPKIASVTFRTGTIPQESAETFWTTGEALPEELKAAQASLLAAAGLKGNSARFLQGLLSALFWTEDSEAAERLIEAARASGVLPSAPVYEALIRIGQGRTEEAQQQIDALERAGLHAPALHYLRARAAAAQGQDKEALQHLAQVALSGSRDAEWTPAAILLEGGIYKRNGQDEPAKYAAAELTERYPGGYWARRAEELK